MYNATVYRHSSGEVAGIFAAARDVTELNRLTEQLQRAEVIGAVEQMGATVAHDLRGPLGQIVQSIRLGRQDPALMPRMLQIAEESAVRSLKMIADWRSSTQRIVPQLVESDLRSVIDNVIEGANLPDNVEVVTSFSNGLDFINTDPDIVRRIIDNLIRNAVEAMPDGGKLSITAKRGEKGLLIGVADTGVGILEASLDQIFTPLYTTKSSGMGLGLTYCKRAIEALGGSIEFESQPSVRTAFRIKHPLTARIIKCRFEKRCK